MEESNRIENYTYTIKDLFTKGNLLTSSNKSVADPGFQEGGFNCVLVVLTRYWERANFDNTAHCQF